MSGPEMSRLVNLLADGLRVWVKRGEVELTDDQIFERARNQAQGVMSEYMLIPHPVVDGIPERRSPVHRVLRDSKADELMVLYAKGKPVGHGDSCRCDRCDLFNRSVTQKERS